MRLRYAWLVCDKERRGIVIMLKKKEYSKYLSYLLRHNPEAANLHMNDQGFVLVDELIANTHVTREELEEIVREDNKQRYSIVDNMIRANQGHSIPVKIDFKPYTNTKPLYHGTSKEAFELIKSSGAILPMSRQFVHLSKDKETAKKVGKRHSHKDEPVILKINTRQMLQDGLKLYESENGVVLAEKVEIKYIICE